MFQNHCCSPFASLPSTWPQSVAGASHGDHGFAHPSAAPEFVLGCTGPARRALLPRAKAETHQLQFRPKESLKLKNNGTLSQVLDQRTLSAWNALRDCRANGMNQNEAQEVAFPNMLLPSESEQEQERLEQEEAEQKTRESP